MEPLIVCNMIGLGDNVYSRPIVRAMQRLYGEIEHITPWPQFFSDLHIKQYPLNSSIRCAQKNISRCRFDGNQVSGMLQVRYDPPDLHRGETVFASMERLTGVRLRSIAMDLPDFGVSPVSGDYILVRPATTRADWVSYSRNPRPEYLVQACEWARADGHRLVMAADIQPGYEDAVEPLPPYDVGYLQGELSTEQLMALTRHARGIIAPVGWVVPVALAYQVPLLAVLGGQLANNSPSVLSDRRLIWDGITWAMPDNPCHCGNVLHECDRRISNLRHFYERFAASL